jgi:hypothetical protein
MADSRPGGGCFQKHGESGTCAAVRGFPQATRDRIAETRGEDGLPAQSDRGAAHGAVAAEPVAGVSGDAGDDQRQRGPARLHRAPDVPIYVEGCRRRARSSATSSMNSGCTSRTADSRRWLSILRTRNIRGIAGRRPDATETGCPPGFSPLWDEFPAVVTGVRTRDRPVLRLQRPARARAGGLRESGGAGLPPARRWCSTG